MRKVLAVVALLAVGFAAGRLFVPRPAPPVEHSTVEFLHISDPAAEPVRLTVYRIVTDGQGRNLRPSAGPDIWRVNLADGRVVLFCSR